MRLKEQSFSLPILWEEQDADTRECTYVALHGEPESTCSFPAPLRCGDHFISQTTLRKVTYPRGDGTKCIHLQDPFMMDNDTSQTSVRSMVTYVPNLWCVPISHHWLLQTPFQSTYGSFFVWNRWFHKAVRKMEKERGKKGKVFNLQYILPHSSDLEMPYGCYLKLLKL